MFEPLLFLYAHETEFAMRVINQGFNVLYEPKAIVQHINSPAHRRIQGVNWYRCTSAVLFNEEYSHNIGSAFLLYAVDL